MVLGNLEGGGDGDGFLGREKGMGEWLCMRERGLRDLAVVEEEREAAAAESMTAQRASSSRSLSSTG